MSKLREVWSGRRGRQGHLLVDDPVDGAVVKTLEGVRIAGWVWLPEGLDAVEVTVNGTTLPANTGRTRRDVPEVVRGAPPDTGWFLWIPEAHLVDGVNVAEVTARGPVGERRETRSFSWSRVHLNDQFYDQVDLPGERLDPRASSANGIFVSHQARYRLAAALAAGARVLDAGCGYGYGSHALLSAGAKSVDGIDLERPVIEQAAADYPSVRFRAGDLRELPYADGSFDLVVCLEVIEHLLEHERVLDEFRRVLTPGGTVVISTPNSEVYPKGNPWHLRELTTAQFEALLASRFRHTVTLTQQLHVASVLGNRDVQALDDAGDPLATADVIKLAGESAGQEEFVVIIASDEPIDEPRPVVTVGDARDELVDGAIEAWMERALTAEAESAQLAHRLSLAEIYGPRYGTDMDEPSPRLTSRGVREAMEDEIARGGIWMYDWALGDLGEITIDPEMRRMHQSRLELMEAPVRAALDAAGPNATVLDLACCEGWFGHRMLEWGAGRVVGVDVSADSIRRARRLRDYLGVERDRLQLHQADVFGMPELPRFDVVLCLGLISHLENPVGALRVARSLTKTLCVVETQLTEQRTPLVAGNGHSLELHEHPASFAATQEADQDSNPLASHGRVLSLIPNEAALLGMATVADFHDPRVLGAQAHSSELYRLGRRAVMVASVSAEA